MRWSIKTDTKIESSVKTTTTTKRFLITIGDIVGMGKSVSGAVKNLAARLPPFIQELKSNKNTSGAATATMVNSIVQPLATIIQGMEIYKGIMGVVEKLTPIMQLVARATGVWCSPGNVADIAQIVLGMVEQILIAILTDTIMSLKEMIWNYEFQLFEISEKYSILIASNTKEAMEKLNENVRAGFENIVSDIMGGGIGGMDLGSLGLSSVGTISLDALRLAMGDVSGGTMDGDSDNVADMLSGNVEDWGTGSGYDTQKVIDGKTNRLLRGSLVDHGIQYSDDNGHTWQQTSQSNGSWCKFAKIRNGTSFRYIALGTHYIKLENLQNADSEENTDWKRDARSQYSLDYFYNDNKGFGRYAKKKKDKTDYLDSIFNSSIGCSEARDFIPSMGIYYSDDDGLTWQESEIKSGYFGNVHEFQEKTGYAETLVVCSFDYKGIKYSVDGITWNDSLYQGESIETGRWTMIDTMDNLQVRASSEDVHITCEAIAEVKIITPANDKQDIENLVDFEKPEIINQATKAEGALREILRYIHENYTDRLPTYSQEFWLILIQDIYAGNYTIEMAKAGERL